MSTLFSPPKVQKPPAVPQVDDATVLRNERDRAARRGAGTAILSKDYGLPDLGSIGRPRAGGG